MALLNKTAPVVGGAKTRRKKPIAPAKDSGQANEARPVVTFTSFDGDVLEIPDLPARLGRATALASERSLSRVWGTDEEEKACRAMYEEM